MSDGDRTTALAEDRTELALLRTLQAADRTLMAWMRTALAMIAFGFGFFKVYQLGNLAVGTVDSVTAEVLALGLVGLGSVLLIGAQVQYVQVRRRLLRAGTGGATFSLALAGALAIVLCGGVAFVDLLLALRG